MQYEFSNLWVDEDGFSVQLSFQNRPASLYVPLGAVEFFADPTAEFGLQFRTKESLTIAAPVEDNAPATEASVPEGSNIVQLDSLRAKQKQRHDDTS